MLSLIVHADDFGLSEKINEGILLAHKHGVLTSTSLVANGAAFEDALHICNSMPSLDVGVHLTLVEEKPLLNANTIPSLVREDGSFYPNIIEFGKRYMTGRICLEEVRAELSAQIKKVSGYDICVTHLDSHQHLHMLPKVLEITLELAKKYDVPAVRIPSESFRIHLINEPRLLLRAAQLLILRLFCYRGRNAQTVRTDHFFGFLYGGNLHKQNLLRLLAALPRGGTCELMCHPGLHDTNTRYRQWGYNWSEELSALTDPDISNLVSTRGIKLISYRDLSQIGRGA